MSRKKANVHLALDRLDQSAKEVEFDISTARIVILSDHHRGRRDGADDFQNNEHTYLEALNYYFEEGYLLVLLGDVEEFWENPLSAVMQSYPEVMQKEKQFADDNRLFRIWGNHDDLWKFKSFFQKHLGKLFPEQQAFEALSFLFKKGSQPLGKMLLVHGHQGSVLSEKFSSISRFFVRYGWRYVQKWFNIPLSTPASNTSLKSSHDQIMYSWAQNKSGQLIISGHTHQPVFMSFTHANYLQFQIKKIDNQIAMTSAEEEHMIEALEKAKARTESELQRIIKDYQSTTLEVGLHRKPCYFNSGCCSFSDGDITGLEIEDGRIRLFKWSMHNGKGRVILEDNDLEHVFAGCK